ncbi:hypothetical protein K439DRAFT_1640396 [Ramaria rubella]|nr:hypothetical protein K439DRAFT_1640396 [Ramaria rubella]
MSLPMSSQTSQMAMAELCLRFPENIGVHAQITYEQAVGLLTQAIDMAQRVPFAWTYIDKPPDGQAYLTFIVPSAPTPIPPDGIRWLDQEKTYRLPAGNRELEVSEVKFGFVPGVEPNASRIRRRFRLTKGGNPQLMLIHYVRGDPIPIPPQFLTLPVRSYPLRPVNDPRVYVAGERMGQRVPPTGPTALPAASPSHPPHVAQPNGVGMNMGLGLGIGGMNQAAALAQQNQAMEVLERERRSRTMAALPNAAAAASAARPPAPDEDDSGDEYENVSTRSLAIERFKRNHELMAEVFTHASKGRRPAPTHISPYASLNINDLNDKVAKLTAEVDALKSKAEARRLAKEAAEAETNTTELQGATSVGA